MLVFETVVLVAYQPSEDGTNFEFKVLPRTES